MAANAKKNVFGDREMMEDALASQKFVTDGYNTYASECSSPAIKSELLNILHEEHQLQHQLFSEMQTRGWYPTDPAPQQKIDQCKSRFGGV